MEALEHLSDDDVAMLARLAASAGHGALGVDEVRSRPGLVEALLRHAATFDAVLGQRGRGETFLPASPFLVFSVAVQRCADDLRSATFVPEWTGPRSRVAVFDVGRLRDFLSDSGRRLFLAEVLASYTKVTSGSFLVQTRRGRRRRRFSELDPVRLASLLEVVPETERAGVYRRLGDLALFLSGVFPDHTATRALGQVDAARLMRAAGLAGDGPLPRMAGAGPGSAGVALMEELGRRWYRLAAAGATPPTAALAVIGDVGERFGQARRILNLLTDRYLFPFHSRWFPAP